jgi:hypothetical protein
MGQRGAAEVSDDFFQAWIAGYNAAKTGVSQEGVNAAVRESWRRYRAWKELQRD